MKKSLTYLLWMIPFLAVGQKTTVLELSGKWKFTIGDKEEYKAIDFDDRSWEQIRVGTPWENEGFENYDGYAWYRYSFDGAKLQAFSNLVIHLGYIDDVHEAYLNGELIGFKGSFPPNFYTAYDALNEYAIPNGLLKQNGENVIAIKVYDIYRDGGLVKGQPHLYFEAEAFENYHSLEGIWKFSTDKKSRWESPTYDDSSWEKIIVPSFWRSKHIRRSEGFGWYRKEFEIPKDLKNKDIYLILGKIDDFDYTYVNGKLVGRTKDFQAFGASQSYDQLRIYKVSRQLLNAQGPNIIAVEVEDIGIDAGIYAGPVGFAESVRARRQ